MKKLDLLIKNGRVIDPAAGVDGPGCIGIRDGLSCGLVPPDAAADHVIDAAGCYVLPGLIDFHTHVFRGGSGHAVDPNSLIGMGVTTAVDAGTAGCANFEVFYRAVVCTCTPRLFTQLNVCSIGQPGDGFAEDFDPSLFQAEKIARLVRDYPKQIRGLKIRMGAEVAGVTDLTPLKKARELAQGLHLPLTVHASNPPAPMAELLDLLGPGDVLAHCFHGKGGHTILGPDGRVRPEVRAARERGVRFDCANGVTNYNHEVAQRALDDGFMPDIISSDLCRPAVERAGYARSLPFVLSKYLWLGMPLEKVIRAAIAAPADALGLGGKAGTLSPGAWGDVTVVSCVEADPVFLDNLGTVRRGDRLLVVKMTVRSGEILFRQTDFG